jgi:SAM-dependent methyltransferase
MQNKAGRAKTLAAKALAAARRLRSFIREEEGIDFSQQSIINYRKHVRRLLAELPYEEAMIRAIGADDRESFDAFGDVQVRVLRHNGLRDGMVIYDVGCGSGRTAAALRRDGWRGTYMGHDIVQELVDHLNRTCPGSNARAHGQLSLLAPAESLDMVFHWSVFTHLLPEECYVYLKDMHRALKPGGRLVFSFLELEEPHHARLFLERAATIERQDVIPLLDTFLHRDWIQAWASQLGFGEPGFTSGKDASNHPAFWQSLTVLEKQ